MSDDLEVSTWSGVRTFHPEMRLEAGAPVEATAEALVNGLLGADFSIKKRDAHGFVAQHTDILAILGGSLNRTVLTVSLAPAADASAAGTAVLVEVDGNGDRAGKRAAKGLSAGVRTLREHGAEVTVHPWQVPAERRRGKRR